MIKFKPIFQIIRPLNILITFVSVIVAGILALGQITVTEAIMYTAFAESIAFSAGNIINDIFDIEIDKINRPHRVLPQEKLSKNSAIIIYIILILFSTILSFEINITVSLIVVLTNVLLFIYSYKIKKLILIDNFLVATVVGSVFLAGASAAGNIKAGIIPCVFALLINFAREIIKDMEDIEGDISVGLTSFPNKYGFQLSKYLILAISITLISFTFYPYFAHIYSATYMILIMILVNPLLIYFLVRLFRDHSHENLSRLSSILKIDMVLGLAAIYLGQ